MDMSTLWLHEVLPRCMQCIATGNKHTLGEMRVVTKMHAHRLALVFQESQLHHKLVNVEKIHLSNEIHAFG